METPDVCNLQLVVDTSKEESGFVCSFSNLEFLKETRNHQQFSSFSKTVTYSSMAAGTILIYDVV